MRGKIAVHHFAIEQRQAQHIHGHALNQQPLRHRNAIRAAKVGGQLALDLAQIFSFPRPTIDPSKAIVTGSASYSRGNLRRFHPRRINQEHPPAQ
jgi:hypothetical protein